MQLLIYTKLFAIQRIEGNESAGGFGDKKNLFTPLQGIKGIEAFTLDYKVVNKICGEY